MSKRNAIPGPIPIPTQPVQIGSAVGVDQNTGVVFVVLAVGSEQHLLQPTVAYQIAAGMQLNAIQALEQRLAAVERGSIIAPSNGLVVPRA